MKTRLLTGIPAALALLALIVWGPSGLLQTVTLVMGSLAYWEYDTLMIQRKSWMRKILLALSIALEIYLLGSDPILALHAFWIVGVLIFITAVMGQARIGNFETALKELALEWLGFSYIVFLFGFLFPIVGWPEVGRAYLLLLFSIVFVGDTTAYFGGMRWGHRKLAPQISPKKTWEGAWAAIISSVIVAILWARWIYPNEVQPGFYWKVVLIAPVLSMLAQLGDLFESVLKRSQMQKDSGAFLPGHGGILDRIDGLVFSAPIFYLFMYYFWETA